MDLSVIASAFVLLFLAEMGDKTQLMTMTLAQRYRALPVAVGVCSAFLVLNLLAVFAGQALYRFVPRQAVLLVAGAMFLVFGWNAWREATREEAVESARGAGKTAFISSFALIFMAELGDKTQLALVALVAGSGHPWSVFVGGTLALWSVSVLGIAVGSALLSRISRAWVHRGAAVLFAVFGAIAIGQALRVG